MKKKSLSAEKTIHKNLLNYLKNPKIDKIYRDFENILLLDNKIDPGEPLSCNMYTEYKKYPDLKKLPEKIEDSLNELNNSKEIKEAFGEDVINSFIKLKNMEIEEFNKVETFDRIRKITDWEKKNTLDC